MADNVLVDNGALTDYTVSSDERTINSVAVHVQRVNDIGSAAIASGQATVGTSAANIVAARDTRKRVILINHGAGDVFVGPAGVTTSTGLKIPSGASVTLQTTAAVQGIASSAGQSVHYLEEYDT